jgi:hypothetical protein
MLMGVLRPLLDNPKKIDETKKVIPTSFPINREERWGRKNYISQEEEFIESSGHRRHRIYRKPFNRSACSKRNASPLSSPKNQRF